MGAMLRSILRGEHDAPDLYLSRGSCHYGYSDAGVRHRHDWSSARMERCRRLMDDLSLVLNVSAAGHRCLRDKSVGRHLSVDMRAETVGLTAAPTGAGRSDAGPSYPQSNRPLGGRAVESALQVLAIQQRDKELHLLCWEGAEAFEWPAHPGPEPGPAKRGTSIDLPPPRAAHAAGLLPRQQAPTGERCRRRAKRCIPPMSVPHRHPYPRLRLEQRSGWTTSAPSWMPSVQAALLGFAEGGPMSIVFAATRQWVNTRSADHALQSNRMH
jgi:hypothetical protein